MKHSEPPADPDRRRLQRIDRLNIPPGGGAFSRDMTLRSVTGRVLLVQAAVFIFMIAGVWAGEFIDWSVSPPTVSLNNVRILEATVDTLVVMVVWIVMIASTATLLHHIRYLEGLLPVCSFCKSIRVDKQWMPLEKYMQRHSSLRLTHSICPSCARRHYQHEEVEDPGEG